jgi:drug/metabolite transporter (DMT)-like permease
MGLQVHLALLAVQLMFASLAPVGKIALREIPPFGLIAFRAPAAAAVLLLFASVRGMKRVELRDHAMLVVYAFFGIIANQLIFILGLQRSTATNAVVIGATIPVFTVGIAVALGKERATASRIAGLAVALCGALVVVGSGFQLGGSVFIGNLLIVLNSLSFSIYLVISRGLLAKYGTVTVITWTMIYGALGVLPFGAGALAEHAQHLSPRAWAAMSYIVLFPTVGTYFLNSWALKRAPSSVVAIYIYVQPVIGALLSAAMLGERPTGYAFAGGASDQPDAAPLPARSAASAER